MWTIKHNGAVGAELPFVLDKAERYATGIRDSVLAKPHGIWRAGVCILLRIGDSGKRSHDREHESNSAQLKHALRSNLGTRNDNG